MKNRIAFARFGVSNVSIEIQHDADILHIRQQKTIRKFYDAKKTCAWHFAHLLHRTGFCQHSN